MLKTVTLQEANGLLPLVREHFWRLHVLLAHLHHLKNQTSRKKKKRLGFDQKCSTLEIIERPVKKKRRINQREVREVEMLVEMEITHLMRLGAVVKGLIPTHIDFLSMKNNEPIFLCWHGGEEEIEHWHQLDDGSPLRHMIAKDGFGPHVVH